MKDRVRRDRRFEDQPNQDRKRTSFLVRGLNSLGVGPRDLITILQSIRAAGALQAELEVR